MNTPARDRPRILVIDDNEAVVTALRALLEREGYEIISGGSCREGTELAATCKPDVILLDWILPDGNGPMLLGTLKELCGAPCMMVTAQDTPEHCVLALEAGCDDFIAKPLRAEELLLRLRRLLSRKDNAASPDAAT